MLTNSNTILFSILIFTGRLHDITVSVGMTEPFPGTTIGSGLTPPDGFVKCAYHDGPVPEGTFKVDIKC